MLKDIFFILKMIGITVLVVLVMQTKIGEKTMEQEFHNWLESSVFVDFIQSSVDGGVALTRTGYKKVHVAVSSTLNKVTRKGDKNERGINLNIKRYNDKENEEDALGLPRAQLSNSKPK